MIVWISLCFQTAACLCSQSVFDSCCATRQTGLRRDDGIKKLCDWQRLTAIFLLNTLQVPCAHPHHSLPPPPPLSVGGDGGDKEEDVVNWHLSPFHLFIYLFWAGHREHSLKKNNNKVLEDILKLLCCQMENSVAPAVSRRPWFDS